MPQTLALKLQADEALAVVVHKGETLRVERVERLPLSAGVPAERGQTLHAALTEKKLNRLHAAIVVSSEALTVQNFDLPPVPASDLPDLVHMQALRDLPLAEDGAGFDFCPLAGDEEHPYRVLGIGVAASQWAALEETRKALDLKVSCVVPESIGWVELGQRIVGETNRSSLTLLATIADRQAIVWASEGDSLRLMRTVWLPADHPTAALGNELRRTLLALAHTHSSERGAVRCIYVGVGAERIAGELALALSRPVEAVSLESIVDGTAGELTEIAPLAAIAAAVAEQRAPAIDLLHPRRRPPAPSRARTYLLASAAALAGVALIIWQGYRNLREPLEAAELARAEREALAPTLEAYALDEAKAAAIQSWLDQSVNLLTELDRLGRKLRPEPLASDEFPVDQDLMLTRLTLTSRQITFEAAARSNDAVQPAERRLRDGNYRVDRGPVGPKSDGPRGYSVSVTETIEHSKPTATPGAGATP